MSRITGSLSASALALLLAACGGGSSVPVQAPTPPQAVQVPLLLSDASSEDWSLIGVKVLSIDLQPQDGGSPVRIFSAADPAPMINLAQLDQIGELLGQASVPQGTYTGATLTVAANPGDVLLTVAADPQAGFDGVPGSSIPADQIQIQGARGSASALSVPVKIDFDSPWTAGGSNAGALDLEVDLAHPAFIVGHRPTGGGATVWAVRFDGPVRHRAARDLRRLVLRHTYGHVTAVADDAASITIEKELPALPVQTPETSVSTAQVLRIQADAANGTLFYDVDAHTRVLVRDFAAQAQSLPGRFVRVAARYQQDGTLVATRIWSSSQFNSVWLSPEGHVYHVDAANARIQVANETGRPVTLKVDADTQFFFRTPENAGADATPIGTGPAFLAAGNLVRGFKVHASVVDPLAAELVAQSIDIETATYDGRLTAADASGFTQTRHFRNSLDDYSHALTYLGADQPNGIDANGNDVSGFKWWNFAYPTQLHTGATGVDEFVAIANGSADAGGTLGRLTPWSASFARWDATSGGWAAANTILMPTRLPLGTVVNPFADGAFTMNLPGGAVALSVAVSTTPGSATLAYQVDRSGGVVSVSPLDVSTAAGLDALNAGLVSGAVVKVYGVPQADGGIRAYALAFYTGAVSME